ncbi:MAG: TraR/DksA family transcriptional regulator [Phycisphaerales bacterium]
MISTKNLSKKKKKRSSASSGADDQPKVIDKPIKTKLSAKDLDRFRDLLLIQRAEQLGDLNAMEAEALRSSGGNLSHMPIHMADVGTDTYEQDFMLSMAESERKLLREIDDALRRIEDKTYGVCQLTGKPIPKTRLNAKPWAKYTIEAARMVENGQIV